MSDDKKFDPKQRKKLNDPLRLKWVPPAKIVHIMDLIEGGEYVDLGAGTGYMSGALGEFADASVIHAIDIEPLMVKEMKSALSDVVWIKPALMERDTQYSLLSTTSVSTMHCPLSPIPAMPL